jgi:hypothetical protein
MMAQDTPQQAEPAYMVATGPAYERLTLADLSLVLRYRAEGKTQVEIAQRLGKSQASISRALKQLGTDTTELAQHHFKARAYRSARRVTDIAEKSADEAEAVKAAKVVLTGAGVIQSGQQVTVNNAVLIAQPDKPETWGPGPSFIEAKAVEGVVAKGDEDHNT